MAYFKTGALIATQKVILIKQTRAVNSAQTQTGAVKF